MTTSASAMTTAASYRSAGRAAIMSGVIGLVAYGFLWAFLVTIPIWTTLVGRKLLKMGRLATVGVTTKGAISQWHAAESRRPWKYQPAPRVPSVPWAEPPGRAAFRSPGGRI